MKSNSQVPVLRQSIAGAVLSAGAEDLLAPIEGVE